MTEILDQFGRPFPARALPDRRPLAAAPLLDSFRDYVSSGLTPGGLATLLQEADQGNVARQAELFSQMEEKDAHLLGEKGKRANVILDVDYTLAPGGKTERDTRVMQFVEGVLEGLTDWDDTLVSLQDAVGKGFAALEMDWDVSTGQAVPTAFEFVEQKRFTFADPDGTVGRVPRLLTDDDATGLEIPAWKLLWHNYGGKSGHPARSGVHRVCSWMYLFKNYTLKDWVVFCEVYGMPLRLGRYDPSASKDDKSALIAALSSLGTDAAGIISKNTEIEFIESTRGASATEVYGNLAGFCNREMSKAILGQTLTAEVGSTGSLAASKTHNEVRLDLVRADSRAVAATVRHQFIRPLVGFNFGWDTPVPGYEATWEEAEDLAATSAWVSRLLDRGVPMPLSFINETFQIPAPKGQEEVIRVQPGGAGSSPEPIPAKQAPPGGNAPAPSPPGGAPDIGYTAPPGARSGADLPGGGGNTPFIASGPPRESGAADAAEAFTTRAERETQGLMEDLLAPYADMVAKAASLADLAEALKAHDPNLADKRLVEIMTRAMGAAHLAGRYGVLYGD